LNAGLTPICVSTCIGRALYFGDKNDPQSLVNEILAANKGKILRMRENQGTEPRVYYLTDDPQFIAGFH
jgi:molybdopterin-containing oxidoreductase family iron-sulfur binding subunit